MEFGVFWWGPGLGVIRSNGQRLPASNPDSRLGLDLKKGEKRKLDGVP